MLWSYLDDFLCAASSLDKTARQYAVFKIISDKLGLIALPSKFEPPMEAQPVLGILYSSASKTVALKSPKSIAVLQVKDSWSVELIQKAMDNLTWVSFVAPCIRAFTTPIILFLIIAVKSKSRTVCRSSYKALNAEVIECLEFLMALVSLDPMFCAYKFVGLWDTRKITPFTDAVG